MASTAAPARSRLVERIEARREQDRRACRADPLVFLERHCTIEETDGTVIRLELWNLQREAARTMVARNEVIVLKARRLGLSWIALALCLWYAINQQGIRILILCKNEDDSKGLLDRVRRMRDRIAADPLSGHLLDGLLQSGDRPERDAVTLLDIGRSTIRALVGTPAAARSETAGIVLLDEFGFQRGAGEIWTAVLPTAEGGGHLWVVSTGNGAPGTGGDGAEFANQWSRAASGESGFAHMFFPWMARPDRDDEWYRAMAAKLGDPDRMRREYPATENDAFITPDTIFAFDHAAINAAEALGRKLDAERAAGKLPPPVGGLAAGVDWGDFRSHMAPIWELERGGLYVPPGEVSTTQVDVENITRLILASLGQYDHWFAEERYDASFKQSNRTFARTAEAQLGPHSRVRGTGRPNTVPVAFGTYKSLVITYLRMLLRRTLAGETTRVLAISPANTELLRQMRGYTQAESGKFDKGDDDAVDALIAGAQPIAKRHRALIDQETS